MRNTVRILSIDGGGIRGVIPGRVLEQIEERTDQPIADLFHMIAGTSTGGILAAGLSTPGDNGRPRLSAADLVAIYRDQGKDIFESSFWHGFGSMAGTVDEKYEADNLERILDNRLGDGRLSQALTDLLVTSYDIERRRPHFFKSWKARGEHLKADELANQRDFHLKDVCRATSAAPTYFEPAWISNSVGHSFALIDGGVFANNPAMCAVAAARVLYPRAHNYLVVSLGTGELERKIPYKDAKNWGLVGWARPLLNVIFDGVSDTVDYQLRQELAKSYFRFQVDLRRRPGVPPAPNDDMDDATPENIERLERRAEFMLKENRGDFNRLLRQLRKPKQPREELAAAPI